MDARAAMFKTGELPFQWASETGTVPQGHAAQETRGWEWQSITHQDEEEELKIAKELVSKTRFFGRFERLSLAVERLPNGLVVMHSLAGCTDLKGLSRPTVPVGDSSDSGSIDGLINDACVLADTAAVDVAQRMFTETINNGYVPNSGYELAHEAGLHNSFAVVREIEVLRRALVSDLIDHAVTQREFLTRQLLTGSDHDFVFSSWFNRRMPYWKDSPMFTMFTKAEIHELVDLYAPGSYVARLIASLMGEVVVAFPENMTSPLAVPIVRRMLEGFTEDMSPDEKRAKLDNITYSPGSPPRSPAHSPALEEEEEDGTAGWVDGDDVY